MREGMLLPSLVALLFALPAAHPAGAPGSKTPARPTVERLGAMCPEEVAACEADSDCAREFKGSFEAGAPPPSEQPSDLLMGIIRCYNANVEGHPKLPADSCPSEMADCEAEEGCVDELHAALNAVAPPTEGSDALMAVVGCLKRVSLQTGKAKGPGNTELLQAASSDCPAELQACEDKSGCMGEFTEATALAKPPTEGSPEMLAIIACLRNAALARRKQQLDKGGDSGRMKFRAEDEMNEEEREAAHTEMVERVAAEVACSLCVYSTFRHISSFCNVCSYPFNMLVRILHDPQLDGQTGTVHTCPYLLL